MASTVRKRRPSAIICPPPLAPPTTGPSLLTQEKVNLVSMLTPRPGDAAGHGGREETFPLMPILSPADNLWQITQPGPSV